MDERKKILRRLALALIPILILAVMLMWVLRDLVRQVFVIPFTYVIWVVNLLAASIPQGYLWVLLVAISAGFAYRSLRTRPEKPADRVSVARISEAETRYPQRERVGFWALQINLGRGEYGKIRFSDFFKRLILEVLSFERQLTPLEVEKLLENQELGAPPEIWNYLRRGRMHRPPFSGGWIKSLLNRIYGLDGDSVDKRPQRRPDFTGRDLERVVKFIEEQLEIDHEY
jgi:hypothetical protein